MQILQLANNLFKCQILTDDKSVDITFIHRITLYCEDIFYPLTFKWPKFPVILALAITINKSKG